jgi:hypothetical protein
MQEPERSEHVPVPRALAGADHPRGEQRGGRQRDDGREPKDGHELAVAVHQGRARARPHEEVRAARHPLHWPWRCVRWRMMHEVHAQCSMQKPCLIKPCRISRCSQVGFISKQKFRNHLFV